MELGRYVFVRTMGLIFTMFVLSIVVFILMHSIPGGPFDLEGGDKGIPLPPAVRDHILKKYGLDGPLHMQYINYVKRAIRFDFGQSFSRPETVAQLIGKTWKVSAQLGLVTFGLAVFFGALMGIVAALYQNRWIDYVLTTFSVGGIVFPNFVVAIVLSVVFGVLLGWLPTSGWDGGIKFWIMPVAAYMLMPLSQIARYTRSSMLETLSEDYVRTARSKGLRESLVIIKHVLRNALIPIITASGALFTEIITGSLFIEIIFRIPGLGSFFVSSTMNRDYPMIMALVLLLGFLFGIINLITDIIYGIVDPRIRLGEKES